VEIHEEKSVNALIPVKEKICRQIVIFLRTYLKGNDVLIDTLPLLRIVHILKVYYQNKVLIVRLGRVHRSFVNRFRNIKVYCDLIVVFIFNETSMQKL
jgi:hypothetical protein